LWRTTGIVAPHFTDGKTDAMVETSNARAEEPLDLAGAAKLSTEEVLSRLASSLQGLSSAEAVLRLRRYGPNALSVRRVHATSVLFRQIRNPILLLLLGAGHLGLAQPSCAFMGTIVHQGSALGVVVSSGSRTAFGQIAAGLTEKQSQTAFEVGLSRFSRFLFGIAGVLTLAIFAINVALSRPLIDALLFSLAIAVGIAPEMMPAIVTVSLSAGSRALVEKRVLVKRLVAIED